MKLFPSALLSLSLLCFSSSVSADEATQTGVGTHDLNAAINAQIRMVEVKVQPKKANGKRWDAIGKPDLIAQLWVDGRILLLSPLTRNSLHVSWPGLFSEPFVYREGMQIKVRVFDRDLRRDDLIGEVVFNPKLTPEVPVQTMVEQGGQVESLRLVIGANLGDPTPAPSEAEATRGKGEEVVFEDDEEAPPAAPAPAAPTAPAAPAE